MNLQQSLVESELFLLEHLRTPQVRPKEHPEVPPPLSLGCPNSHNIADRFLKEDGSSTQEGSPSPKFSKPPRKGSLLEEAIRVRSRLNSIESEC